MGQSRRRVGKDGKPRYTAYYEDLSGRRCSAGTYGTRRAADSAWQKAEVRVSEGRGGDPRRGRQKFQRYVEEEWFPNHQLELTARQTYRYLLDAYILPTFGTSTMVEIMPAQVREWVTGLKEKKVGAPTIDYCMTVLSAVFTTAFNDQVTFLHPCKGVKRPPIAKKTRRVVTPEQYDVLHRALPDEQSRMLVETDIETGLRWGELAELRIKDIDWVTGIITVTRVVIELSPKFHPTGGRFLVKEYPKDEEHREVSLGREFLPRLQAHVAGREPDDLLFAAPAPTTTRRTVPEVLPDPSTLGLTEPNADGRRYRHGTPTAYGAGRCRCEHCRNAVAAYRARRRAAGQDHPRKPRTVDTDGHISRNWFRNHIWLPAVQAAQLGFKVRVHDLRHAHASWLLAGGADLQVVKERLGHGSIATTEKYLHTLPGAHDAALDALSAVRNKRQKSDTPAEPDSAKELAELRKLVASLTTMVAGMGSKDSAAPSS